MEKDKGSKVPAFRFDIELELKDEVRRKELAKHIQERITLIKEWLRKGRKKEEYDQLGILLNAYHALAVVLGRASYEVATPTEKVRSQGGKGDLKR